MPTIPAPARTQPNILFIMADQQRWDYLGYMGADWVDTPNIDRLAARGTVYTHCYTNTPVCAPARIGLACGLSPHRIGSLANNSFLPLGIPTYYQRVRDAGYHVGCVGKLDLAKPIAYNGPAGQRPLTYTWGFTHPVEAEGKMHAGHSDTPHGPYTQYLHEHGLLANFHADYCRRAQDYVGQCHDSVLPTHAFEDTWIGARSAQWIDTIPGDYPWHLFVSFVGPHDPFDPPTEYAERYRDRAMPTPVPHTAEGKPARVANAKPRDPDLVLKAQRQYCAAIAAIDDAVGEILAALERRGWGEDTIIVFSADHGEQLYDQQLWTKGYPYDPSWRIPLAICGPGIREGARLDTFVELIDVGETVCELAGAEPRNGLDARSFLASARGQTTEHRPDTMCTYSVFEAIRDRRYKFIRNHSGVNELYDMQADPGEQRNIAAQNPEVVADLNRRLAQRLLTRVLPH